MNMLLHHGLLIGAICLRWRVDSFAPRPRRTTTSTARQRTSTRRRLAPISELQDFLHTLHHAADHHPALDSLLTTLVSSKEQHLEPLSHGHSNPLFGPKDPLLQEGTNLYPSIPIPNVHPPKVDLPKEWTDLMEQYPDEILDNRKMLEVNVDGMPGFHKIQHLFPTNNQPDIVEIEREAARDPGLDLYNQVKYGNLRMLNELQRLPLAVAIAGLLDYFVVSPAVLGDDVEIYADDLEDEETRDKVMGRLFVTLLIRGVVLIAIVYGTFVMTEPF